MAITRCAVYTRKSSEEGLEQNFNSLHAQREACEAYVLSQKHEGWVLVPTANDDGGFSGGSMERPGLKALLADVEAGLIDTVVVYKVDRLTRSLADFAKMVERFDARSVSFVSVTQAFNITTSMGRLTLNVLLSFAQFEREVTGERIRDKIAASKAKGMWMGGMVPLGYDVVDRALIINPAEADQVRTLFDLYLAGHSVDRVVERAAELNIRSKTRTTAKSGKVTGGTPLGRGSLYAMLGNPIYVGEIGHGDKRYPGQHEALLDRGTWDAAQARLAASRRKAKGTRSAPPALLSGLVRQGDGARMTASHTVKATTRYCYYASDSLRVPARDLDAVVVEALVTHLSTPEMLAGSLHDLTLLTPEVVTAARGMAQALRRAGAAAKRDLLLDLVEQVTLGNDTVITRIRLGMIGLDGHANVIKETELGRAKARLALVVPGARTSTPDRALINIVAQARAWFEDLASGACDTLAAIAQRHGVTTAYVRQHIGAAFLAPDIVAAIVEGRQPRVLTVATLRDLLPLPLDWGEQRTLLAQQN